ncbi:DUF4041 domain-containing protein [Roseicyclus marinus]|uniref:DUF4041 domain-containing protein n=1 Tax=Roseicyclus marinus TaxID=2161673 RepID=UPI00240F8FEE|nr:DUF4041 domain-containing protein [Roseicyclus marinus]MDG3041122.1 DUF4041 domain-containing protein [Roseicyclus marinus]
MDPLTITLLVWILLPFPLIFLWLRSRSVIKKQITRADEIERDLTATRDRYSAIISLEEEAGKLRSSIEDSSKKMEVLRMEYSQKRELLIKLEGQLAVYDERLSFAELGVYEPHFDFTDSQAYKTTIEAVRQQQKDMVSLKTATRCPTNWTVDGSRSKGETMINRQTRLTMRAFNNECEAAIANARWNNVNAMEKRIVNAANQINKANESMQLVISDQYVALKLKELHLTHEYRERLKLEKDERAELARAEREEKKLLAEAEEAEKEERKFQQMLDKAKAEAGVDEKRISDLEAALAEAHARSERARAMAEMTKSGYVYIISNIGSFGEDVVKIGLTRRLDPDDRVRELGDASVPFSFDTHAMIYSDEAPALEAALHREFSDKRVNASNMRKEFFRVSLNDVEEAVRKLSPNATFFRDREAQEWHETMSRRNQALLDLQKPSDSFPENI